MKTIVKHDTLTTAMAIAETNNVCGNMCKDHLMVYDLPKIAKMHVHARNAGIAIYADENLCEVLPADHIADYVTRVGESPASKQYRGKFYAYMTDAQMEKTLTFLFATPEKKSTKKESTKKGQSKKEQSNGQSKKS